VCFGMRRCPCGPLTAVERGSVTGKRLRIASARSGERLENLGARTGNVWSPSYTALVNGLDAEGTLGEGQLVKIAPGGALESAGGKSSVNTPPIDVHIP
jgi:predicted Zn-dependent protease